VAIVGMKTLEELRLALKTAREFRPMTPAEISGLGSRGKELAAQWGPLRGPVA
jgi:nitrogen regulatory protein PII